MSFRKGNNKQDMVHKVYISIFVVSAVQTTDVRMAAAKDNLSQDYRNWFQVFILIDFGGRQLCRDLLFKKKKIGRLME